MKNKNKIIFISTTIVLIAAVLFGLQTSGVLGENFQGRLSFRKIQTSQPTLAEIKITPTVTSNVYEKNDEHIALTIDSSKYDVPKIDDCKIMYNVYKVQGDVGFLNWITENNISFKEAQVCVSKYGDAWKYDCEDMYYYLKEHGKHSFDSWRVLNGLTDGDVMMCSNLYGEAWDVSCEDIYMYFRENSEAEFDNWVYVHEIDEATISRCASNYGADWDAERVEVPVFFHFIQDDDCEGRIYARQSTEQLEYANRAFKPLIDKFYFAGFEHVCDSDLVLNLDELYEYLANGADVENAIDIVFFPGTPGTPEGSTWYENPIGGEGFLIAYTKFEFMGNSFPHFLVHEFGHFFGLVHPSRDDNIDDTPTSCFETSWNVFLDQDGICMAQCPDGSLLHPINIMEYDACGEYTEDGKWRFDEVVERHFTDGQIEAMEEVLDGPKSNYKNPEGLPEVHMPWI